MRIAWTGASIGDISSGSVAALAGQLLLALLERGDEVDFYSTGDAGQLPEPFASHPRLTVVAEQVPWSWDRWYSRNKATAFVTSLAVRAWTQVRLSGRLLRNHRRRRYDGIFQFSQTELLLLGVLAGRLPPIVVQPSTIASGELEWHRRESAYARQVESTALHYLARAFMAMRAAVQRRQLRQARLVVGASRAFVRTIQDDYGVPPGRTRVVPHPIDLDYYADVGRPRRGPADPIVLLFASRLSARKGLEMVVDLSHHLDDLAPGIRILVLGGASMWSDYSKHLSELNPRVAQPAQAQHASRMKDLYGQVDAVLTPSHWEPFSLVTAEALAAGVPVVASDQIGAAEGVDPSVCRIFPAGDAAAFEAAVRRLVEDLRRDGAGVDMAVRARAEARRNFAPERIGAELHEVLEDACGERPLRRSGPP